MTIRCLKKLLEHFNDDDRLIIDNGEKEANPMNEILFAYKVKMHGKEKLRPVVICQTRNDFDVPNELKAQMERFVEESWDEVDALAELMEYGFTIEDFKFDQEQYEWARRTAEDHGLI